MCSRKNYYDNVLYIGTHYKGKGGIATVIRSYKKLAKESFHFVSDLTSTHKIGKIYDLFMAIFVTFYYCIFKHVRILHIHTASYISFYRESIFVWIGKLFGKKIVLHIHGGEFEKFYHQSPEYVTRVCGKADVIVCVSDYFKGVFTKLRLNTNIETIYNSVGHPRCQKKIEERNPLHVLFMGTICKSKGVYDILECVGKNADYFRSRIILHIGGEGELDKLNSVIEQYGIVDFVVCHGWLDEIQKHQLLAETDIYLQPSYFESLGIAIIEAMSYSIPVIATNCGGIPELVKNEVNGWLIEPGNPDQLFKTLCTCIENPQLRRLYGERGLIHSQRFSEAAMEKDILALYQRCLES